MYMYFCVYMYMHVCIHMEREKEREGGREGEACVYVCSCDRHGCRREFGQTASDCDY